MNASFNDPSIPSDPISWEASRNSDEQQDIPLSVLSVYFKNDLVGIAFYDGESKLIRIMEDVEESNSLTIVSQRIVLLEISASLLLIPPKLPTGFVEKISQAYNGIEIVHRPISEYKLEASLRIISSLKSSSKENPTDKSQYSISCVKSLMNILKENGYQQNLLGVDWCSFSCFMHIDLNALESLQIFSNEDHPNRQNAVKKDGQSIFSLLNTCNSSGGKKLLKNWCLRPLQDCNAINQRLDLVSFFTQPANSELERFLSNYLSKIPNIKTVLLQLKIHPKSGSFQSLLKFAESAKSIQECLENCSFTHPIIDNIKATDLNGLKVLWSKIKEQIDFDQSKLENRVVIKPRQNHDLDQRRQFYSQLPEFLSVVAQEVASEFQFTVVSKLNVVYFPQLGFLVTIPLSEDLTLEKLSIIDDLRLQFATGKFAYFKNSKMIEMDNNIGDVHSQIVDIEVEMILALQKEMVLLEQEILLFAEKCYELDCITALAKFARTYSLQRPFLTDQPIMDIVNGRHLLCDIINDSFVPNNCKLGLADSVSAVILSGPNSSGKSVFLKQIGIIVYLVHIGSFVPADPETCIGITDKILTRIITKESSSKDESAFMSDLEQMKTIIDEATSKSLVLIDEFGKGTLVEDGVALFTASVKWLIRESNPRLIAITHFHEIYQNGLLSDQNQIAHWTMDILLTSDSSKIECFLYKVKPLEKVVQSYGFFCAELAGLDPRLIERATVLKKMFEQILPVSADVKFAQVDPIQEKENIEIIKEHLLM